MALSDRPSDRVTSWLFGSQWNYRQTVYALTFLSLFSIMSARIVISPIVPAITDSFDVSTTAIGTALSGLTVFYAFAQLASGVLGDRHGERTVILFALVLTVGASVLLATSPNFVVFGAFTLVLGVGSGLYRTSAESLLERIADDPDAAISTHAAGAATAGLLTPTVAVATMRAFGWRVTVTLGGAAALVVLMLFWRFCRPTVARTDSATTYSFGRETLTAFATNGGLVYTTAVAVVSNFTFQTFLTFLPVFLIQRWGLSAGLASTVFSVVAFCSIVGLPVVGHVSERYLTRDETLTSLFTAAIAGFVLLVFGWGPHAVWPGAVLLGVGLSWSGLLTSRVLDFETEIGQSSALGLHKTVTLLFGALGPVSVGTVADATSWRVAYGLVIVLLALALASLVVVWVLDFDI